MNDRQLIHKWFGGESTGFVHDLIVAGMSYDEAHAFVLRLAVTAERRRSDSAMYKEGRGDQKWADEERVQLIEVKLLKKILAKYDEAYQSIASERGTTRDTPRTAFHSIINEELKTRGVANNAGDTGHDKNDRN